MILKVTDEQELNEKECPGKLFFVFEMFEMFVLALAGHKEPEGSAVVAQGNWNDE